MPAPPPLCPGNPKGGHWWICEDTTGRFSSAHCNLCPAVRTGEDAFANTFDEVAVAQYGYLDGQGPRKGKKRVKKREPGSSLTADERTKRHIFYEAHREEIIEVYHKLKGNAKAAAQELSKKWQVEVPTTTMYGLLKQWKIKLDPLVPEPEPKAKVKRKRKRKVKTSQVLTRNQLGRFVKAKVEVEKRIEKAGIVGDLTCLERTADGHIKATVLFGSDAELMLGLILVGKT
jgi:hypothetical protein